VAFAIYTIGHSTRPLDAFLELLAAHDIRQVVDIRSFPASRRHPQYGKEALAASLRGRSIGYRHEPSLGGRRTPRRDSHNTAWKSAGFRGYADHMQTSEFQEALDALIRAVQEGPRTAIMCAEAVWWRCHRQLVADALLARGVEVRHITSSSEAARHELTDFARVEDGRISYPGLV
jgi:uncharacterized protein (DUF488 family)